MKIRPAGTELFHAERPTDMTKLTVAFRILRTRLKNPHWQSLTPDLIQGWLYSHQFGGTIYEF